MKSVFLTMIVLPQEIRFCRSILKLDTYLQNLNGERVKIVLSLVNLCFYSQHC